MTLPPQTHQVVQKLAHELLHVLQIDKGEDDLQCTTADGGIVLLQTADDRSAMARHGRMIQFGQLHMTQHAHTHLQHHRESHIADVAVAVQKELAQDVGAQHALTADRINAHDRPHRLVQNGVTCHARAIRLRGDLSMMKLPNGYEGKEIAERVTALAIVGSQQTEEFQHLHLKEGIGYTAHVILALEAATDDHLHLLDKARNKLAEFGNVGGVLLQNEGGEGASCG